jgi:hypothetical protein
VNGSRTLLAVLFAALVLVVDGATAPVARVTAEGAIVVTLPREILNHRDVHKQLNSGLTTTFLITATQDGTKGAARVEVRYEPWDEVYLVTTRGIDDVARTSTLPSAAKLAEWWRSAALPVLRRAGSGDLQLTLEVLPFSIEEQKETQRWLTRSLGEAHRAEAIDESEEAGRSAAGSVLDALIGTSIQRRPLVRHRWNVAVTR